MSTHACPVFVKDRTKAVYICAGCTTEFVSALPQDPHLPEGEGRCLPCRGFLLLESHAEGLGGRMWTKDELLRHFARHA